MATPFSATTSIRRSLFHNPPPKPLLSLRDYNGGLNCVKCGSSSAHLCSWKSASNYVRLNQRALLLSTQLSVSGNVLKNRRGVVRAATIEEIEAEKTLIEKDVKARMEKTIDTVRSNFNSIRTGRSNPAMLDKIEVEYYGSPVSLKSIAQISTPDASSLLVQPYDKSSLKSIEKAIVNSDLGLTPNNDGEVIRLTLPQLTSERRKVRVSQLNPADECEIVPCFFDFQDFEDSPRKTPKSMTGFLVSTHAPQLASTEDLGWKLEVGFNKTTWPGAFFR